MVLFGMILLIFFAIIGLCAFVTALIDILYKGDQGGILVLRDLTPDNAEVSIRTAARICMRHTGIRLVCICEEDSAVAEICRLMQREYPFLETESRMTV